MLENSRRRYIVYHWIICCHWHLVHWRMSLRVCSFLCLRKVGALGFTKHERRHNSHVSVSVGTSLKKSLHCLSDEERIGGQVHVSALKSGMLWSCAQSEEHPPCRLVDSVQEYMRALPMEETTTFRNGKVTIRRSWPAASAGRHLNSMHNYTSPITTLNRTVTLGARWITCYHAVLFSTLRTGFYNQPSRLVVAFVQRCASETR